MRKDRITEAILRDLRKAGYQGDPTDREAVKAFLKRRDHAGWRKAANLARMNEMGKPGKGTLLGLLAGWWVAKRLW